jgi:HlyD family secretion protein
MFASVNLIINSRNNILTIPTQAIVRDTSGSIVYIAKSDSAFRKTVTVGLEQNSRMEILSGITDSNRVIVIGQQYVRDKSPVKIQP